MKTPLAFNQSLSEWEVFQVTDMSNMFYGATMFNQNLTTWRVCNVADNTNFNDSTATFNSSFKPLWDNPCVESVDSSKQSYLFGTGQVIDIVIEFDRVVSVQGKPRIEIGLDNGEGSAVYISGSGTESLRFEYTAEKGDSVEVLNYINRSSLNISNGRIFDSENKDAVLTLPINDKSLSRKYIRIVPDKLFISEWDSRKTNTGSTPDGMIKLPLLENGEYDFKVLWGENSTVDHITSWNQSETMHTYRFGDEYTIYVWGKIKGFSFNNMGDRNKLLGITQWGGLELGNDGGYFYGAENLQDITATDVHLGETTNLNKMFAKTNIFNGSINHWDVSKVTSMREMFSNALQFNTNLSEWDVRNVKDMNNMFSGARKFNQPLDRWEPINVTNMDEMFVYSLSFKQNISSWRVCSLESEPRLFDLNANSAWTEGEKPHWSAPCILKASVTSQPSEYLVGDTINFTVEFNKPVVVEGIPQLEIGFYFYNESVNYTEGNLTRKLTFSYLVKDTDQTFTLDYLNIDSLKVGDRSFVMSNISDAVTKEPAMLKLPLRNTLSFHRTISVLGTGLFTSVWDTRETTTGSSDGYSLSLPLEEDGTYNFVVYWGDDTPPQKVTKWNATTVNHTYALAGVKTVRILGTLEGFRFNNNGDRNKLISIEKWGDGLRLGNKGAYFYGAENLYTIKTDPRLETTTTLSEMFKDATNFDGVINHWDLSTITDMSSMFENADSFDRNISGWDVSNVQDMSKMFKDTIAFNGDVSGWDVSSLEDASEMFSSAVSFNQPISTWDVSNLKNLERMFSGASQFNQPLNNWDLSKAETMDNMFSYAHSFNQPLKDWNVINVTSMNNLFRGSPKFNHSLSDWRVCNVESYRDFDRSAPDWTADKPLFDRACVQLINSTNVDGLLAIGDLIDVKVVFSGNVSVNVTNGTPFLELSFDGGNKNASFISVEEDELTFQYVLAEGDNTQRLNYTSKYALNLNNSNITDDTTNQSVIVTLPRGKESFGGIRDVPVAGNVFTSYWDTRINNSEVPDRDPANPCNCPLDEFAGSSNSNQIQLPLEPNGEYDFKIFWGDGTSQVVKSWDSENTLPQLR